MAEAEGDDAGEGHQGGQSQQRHGEALGLILDEADQLRASIAAEIAQRVDEGDAAGRGGAAQEGGRQRLEHDSVTPLCELRLWSPGIRQTCQSAFNACRMTLVKEGLAVERCSSRLGVRPAADSTHANALHWPGARQSPASPTPRWRTASFTPRRLCFPRRSWLI